MKDYYDLEPWSMVVTAEGEKTVRCKINVLAKYNIPT